MTRAMGISTFAGELVASCSSRVTAAAAVAEGVRGTVRGSPPTRPVCVGVLGGCGCVETWSSGIFSCFSALLRISCKGGVSENVARTGLSALVGFNMEGSGLDAPILSPVSVLGCGDVVVRREGTGGDTVRGGVNVLRAGEVGGDKLPAGRSSR